MIDIFNNILQYFDKYKILGSVISVNNTKLIAKAPHIGEEAWLHELYVGLTVTELKSLEEELGTSLPNDFKSFLSISNGLAFFITTLSIYGVRRTNSRDYEIREPFSIISKNKNEKPISLSQNQVLIGSYYGDSSKLVLDTLSGKVLRYDKSYTNIRNTWDSFQKFINVELPRIDACFDSKGIIQTELKNTLPDKN